MKEKKKETAFLLSLSQMSKLPVIKRRVPLRSCQHENNKREITVNIFIISHYKLHLSISRTQPNYEKKVCVIVQKIR